MVSATAIAHTRAARLDECVRTLLVGGSRSKGHLTTSRLTVFEALNILVRATRSPLGDALLAPK